MTNQPNQSKPSKQTLEHSALSPSLDGRAGIRVRPADFAKIMNVSRQTVSQWIKQGKCTLGADGRLDPHQAAKQVIAASDPSRLRARTLRPATEERTALLAQIEDLKAQLQRAADPVALLAAELDRARIEIAASILAERINVRTATDANVVFCAILTAIDNARMQDGLPSNLADLLEHRLGNAATLAPDDLEMSDIQLIEMRGIELSLDYED